MFKKIFGLGIGVILIVLGVQSLRKSSRDSIRTELPSSAPTSLSSPYPSDSAVRVASLEKAALECFPEISREGSLSDFAKKIQAADPLGPSRIIEENFELLDEKERKWVVQFIPAEKESVRVFSISPTDGLPDRVRKFPAAGADIAARLVGALSLGKTIAKTVTSSQFGDGRELVLETRNGEIISVRYRSDTKDFECIGERCSCNH